MRSALIGVALMLASSASCARRVVLDPSQVPARNDPAWTIRQAPTSAPEHGAPTATGDGAPGASRS
jgi:hypothetical protein